MVWLCCWKEFSRRRTFITTVAYAGCRCKTCSSSGLWRQSVCCEVPCTGQLVSQQVHQCCFPACRAPRSWFTGWVGWLLSIFYVLALGFYGYVRVVHTLGHGGFM